MKKYFRMFVLLAMSSWLLVSNFASADEVENKLESASFKIEELIANLDTNSLNAIGLKATFVLRNISGSNVKTKLHIQRISLVSGHVAEYCFGTQCSFFPPSYDPLASEMTSSEFDFEKDAVTNPNLDGYIRMTHNGAEGEDTLRFTVFNSADESDFIRFTATWSFKNGSIRILTSENLQVYPNPVTDYLYLNVNDGNEVNKVEIYDAAGNLIQFEDVSHLTTSDNSLAINVENFQKGLFVGYLIRAGIKISAFRFVK